MASTKGDGRTSRGRAGEQAAQALLEREGYRIVDTNVRFGSTTGLVGELDIIAWDGPALCFIEVKSRTGIPGRVHPGEAITPAKQRQIARLALAYATRCGLLAEDGANGGANSDSEAAGFDFRFDVVTVVFAPSSSSEGAETPIVRRVELWRGAFLAGEV